MLRSLWLLAALTTLASATAVPAQTPDTVKLRTTPVAGGVYLLRGGGGNIAASGARVPPSPAVALPVIAFTDTLTFYLNTDSIQVFHVAPAHTEFTGLYPFIDYCAGGSLDGVIAAVDRGLALSDNSTRIIHGHGPLANRADLRRYREMLAAVRIRNLSARNKGLRLEQAFGRASVLESVAAT